MIALLADALKTADLVDTLAVGARILQLALIDIFALAILVLSEAVLADTLVAAFLVDAARRFAVTLSSTGTVSRQGALIDVDTSLAFVLEALATLAGVAAD